MCVCVSFRPKSYWIYYLCGRLLVKHGLTKDLEHGKKKNLVAWSNTYYLSQLLWVGSLGRTQPGYSGSVSLTWLTSDDWSGQVWDSLAGGLLSPSLHAVSEPLHVVFPHWHFWFPSWDGNVGVVRPFPWQLTAPVWVIQPARWKICHFLGPSLRSQGASLIP